MSNKRRKSKKSGVKKFFLTLLVLVLCCVVGLGGYSYYSLYKMNKNSASKNADGIDTQEIQKGDPVNILVVGVDIGDPKAKTKNIRRRTDTMIVMHYDPQNKKASLVSIPRDTKVEINGRAQKINDANVIGGMKSCIDSVENLLDININYYVKLDYEGFRKIIDAIGGVDMPITHNMNYVDDAQNLSIHFKKGTVAHLDGKKAEEFFRWRKNNDGTGFAEGDIGRIGNQHLFIQKVIEKVKSPSIIFKLKNILDVSSKYVTTNLTPSQIVAYGMDISKLNSSNIKMSTLAGEGKYIKVFDGKRYVKVSYFFYDPVKSEAMLKDLRNGMQSNNVVNNEDSKSSLDKSSLKIKVLNGTKKSGLAARYAKDLRKKGYTNIETGNNETPSNVSRIILNKEFSNSDKQTIKRNFGINNIQNGENQEDADIIVILGENQDYIK